ncbi:MAG: hypothetical protein K6T31_11145 [Alicyclobacillus sp.]|nr:hypothetical protein [Alicyclobacillus sp.]
MRERWAKQPEPPGQRSVGWRGPLAAAAGNGRRWRMALLTAVAAGLSWGWPQWAWADIPAVTDFGQSSRATPAWSQPGPGHARAALFLTLYPDGQSQVQICPVGEDAVAGFLGEHPVWHWDAGLTWFMQMPVYVRVLTPAHVAGVEPV